MPFFLFGQGTSHCAYMFLSVIKNATPVQPIICGEEKGIGYDADAHSNMLF